MKFKEYKYETTRHNSYIMSFLNRVYYVILVRIMKQASNLPLEQCEVTLKMLIESIQKMSVRERQEIFGV